MKQFNREVFFSGEQTVKVARKDMDFLVEKSLLNKRKRIRLCTHEGIEDSIHEMFIVHARDTYVRPHKHLNKRESLHLIEGFADAVFFDDKGNLTNVLRLGNYESGLIFYYRISNPSYHSLIIRSDIIIFHEVTNGPFNRADTVFADWAPDENDIKKEDFMRRTMMAADNFIKLGEQNER